MRDRQYAAGPRVAPALACPAMRDRFVFLSRLTRGYIWRRIVYERLSEPLHLNALSLVVALVGSFRLKVAFDLVLRRHIAYSLLKCADQARALGLGRVSVVEFGVAAGTGLLNMCALARRVTAATGVAFDIYGFDTGEGMPPPRSYKDHPELYQAGDYPMDVARLRAVLPPNAKLVIGPIGDTIGEFVGALDFTRPIGFVAIDVDYYHSAKDALQIFCSRPEMYLPRTLIYLDDVEDESHNRFAGELAAIDEFNEENQIRKIDRNTFLRGYRILKNAWWIDHMFTLHVFDHPTRSVLVRERDRAVLPNPYIR
jgi:hypothetical protein